MTHVRLTKSIFFAATAAACILIAGSPAGAIVLDTANRGSYRGDTNAFGTGLAGTSIGNFQTGFNTPAEYRSFFNFDLSGLSGTVTSATFRITLAGTAGSGAPGSPLDGLAPITTETVTIFDVTTDINALINNTGGAAAFADLGDGFAYGSASVSTDENTGTVDFVFDSTGLANVNAALGGNFALGGTLTSLDSNEDFEFLFGFSAGGFTRLDLTFRTGGGVPEPAPLSVIALGLFGVGLFGWRRREGTGR